MVQLSEQYRCCSLSIIQCSVCHLLIHVIVQEVGQGDIWSPPCIVMFCWRRCVTDISSNWIWFIQTAQTGTFVVYRFSLFVVFRCSLSWYFCVCFRYWLKREYQDIVFELVQQCRDTWLIVNWWKCETLYCNIITVILCWVL